MNAEHGETILKIAEKDAYQFAEVDDLGNYVEKKGYMDKHIDEVLNLELVDVEAIKKANFKVVVDAVNSTGGIAIPALLEKLGVECVKLYCEPNGHFPHNPEPLKEHLTDISELVVKEGADFGIVVDPDVDRLALVCEDGSICWRRIYSSGLCRLCTWKNKRKYGFQFILFKGIEGCYGKTRRKLLS